MNFMVCEIYLNKGVTKDLTRARGLPAKCAEVTEAKGSEDACKGRTIVMDHRI